MTEREWATSNDPEKMHEVVAEEPFRSASPYGQWTDRKRVLFSVACCRLVWPLIEVDERCVRMVESYERQFDEGVADDEAEEQLVQDAKDAAEHPEDETPDAQQIAANLVYDIGDTQVSIGYLLRSLEDWGDPRERATRIADIMRDILGNPFRPVAFHPDWRTEHTVGLARKMYDERDFRAMPILADALEEAGCDNADILSHCRAEKPHVFGCWVIDLLLEKE